MEAGEWGIFADGDCEIVQQKRAKTNRRQVAERRTGETRRRIADRREQVGKK